MRNWFTEHPLYDAEGQPIVVPEWQFPARGRVKKQLERAKMMAEKTERVLQALPLRGKQASWAAKLDERKTEIDRAYQYVQLYGLYTECEAIYQVDNLMRIHDGLDADRPRRIQHRPALASTGRSTSAPSTCRRSCITRGPRPSRARAATTAPTVCARSVLSPDRHVAAFDLENTLIASNVVESYSYLATRRLNTPERIRYVLRTLAEAPTLSAMDRKDRGDFLRFFYRRYEDAPVSQIDEDSQELLTNLILTKSFPAGIRRVREHRALGHRTILITGALDFAVEGLRPLFDEIIAAEDDRASPTARTAATSRRCRPPARHAPRSWPTTAAPKVCKLEESIAYADSTSDLPMLEAVGFPVAVNPETRLAAIARKRGWLVEDWSKAAGGPRPLLPIGPLLSERERGRKFA